MKTDIIKSRRQVECYLISQLGHVGGTRGTWQSDTEYYVTIHHLWLKSQHWSILIQYQPSHSLDVSMWLWCDPGAWHETPGSVSSAGAGGGMEWLWPYTAPLTQHASEIPLPTPDLIRYVITRSANQRPVSRSRDLSWPIRGQWSLSSDMLLHVTIFTQETGFRQDHFFQGIYIF